MKNISLRALEDAANREIFKHVFLSQNLIFTVEFTRAMRAGDKLTAEFMAARIPGLSIISDPRGGLRWRYRAPDDVLARFIREARQKRAKRKAKARAFQGIVGRRRA